MVTVLQTPGSRWRRDFNPSFAAAWHTSLLQPLGRLARAVLPRPFSPVLLLTFEFDSFNLVLVVREPARRLDPMGAVPGSDGERDVAWNMD